MDTKTLTANVDGASASDVKITVAICTHNRAEMFDECVKTLMPQLDDTFEVIIVDSASSPEHAARAAATVAPYPNVQFERLEKPGVSFARNTILSRAKGEWFATLDDDAVPAPDWAKVLTELTSTVGPEFGLIGGAVHPLIPAGAERPLGPRWQQLISAIETKGEYDQTDKPKVVAANLCFRREGLIGVGGFPEALGRVAGSLVSGEDKFPVEQMLRYGWRLWYSERLSVGHHIHRERLFRKWATRRAYWDGRCDRRIRRLMGFPTNAFQVGAIALKCALVALLYFVPDVDQEYFLRFWYNLGWLQEAIWPPTISTEA